MYLTDEEVEELESEVRGLTYAYVPNKNGPDYRCQFCGAEPRHVSDLPKDVQHDEDCYGKRLLALIQDRKNLRAE